MFREPFIVNSAEIKITIILHTVFYEACIFHVVKYTILATPLNSVYYYAFIGLVLYLVGECR